MNGTLLQRRGRHRLRPGGEGTLGIILYQQNDVLNQRIPSLDLFADYFKAVEAAGEQHSGKGLHLHGAAIVVGVRPGRESRVWYVPDEERGWQPPPGLVEMTRGESKGWSCRVLS